MSQIGAKSTATTIGALTGLVPDSGTNPVVPNGAMEIELTSSNGITTVGGLNTIDINLTPDVRTYAETTTVGNVSADIITITFPFDRAVYVDVTVIGVDTDDFTKTVAGSIYIHLYNDGAGIVLFDPNIGSSFIDTETVGVPASIDITVEAAGDDLIIRVNGAVGKTYQWTSRASWIIAS